jgi:hypothetical protein
MTFKDFLFIYAFYFLLRSAYICDLGVGISTVFEIIGHFLFKGERLWGHVPSMVMTTYHYMFSDTRNKNIYGLWVGISTVFKILEHLQFRGTGPFRMVMINIPSNAPCHKNIPVYGLGVGISMVFEILGHSLFNGLLDHHVQSCLTYHQMLLDTRNKNIYSLGVENSTVFKI